MIGVGHARERVGAGATSGGAGHDWPLHGV